MASVEDLPLPELLADGRFHVLRKICKCSLGIVVEAEDVHRGDRVAVKVQLAHTGPNSKLSNEAQVYRDLQPGGNGIPLFRHHGYGKSTDGQPLEFLVMNLKGPDLREVFKHSPHAFHLERVLSLGIQMLDRVEWLHQKGYVHGDVKPSNFVLGTGAECYQITLIDFDLAQKYVTGNGEHVPFAENRRVGGSFPYRSLNAHEGKRVSRLDDLWSIGYTLLLFLRKSLPWSHFGTRDGAGIMNCERETSVEELCRGYPKQFGSFLEYCSQLEYAQQPDYGYLRGLLENLWKKLGTDTCLFWDVSVYRAFPSFNVKPKTGSEEQERALLRKIFPGDFREFVGNGVFQLRKLIGSGGFGVVVQARDLEKGEDVAVKFLNPGPRTLSNEAEIYDDLCPGVGVPEVHYTGYTKALGNREFFVMDLLGPSLAKLAHLSDDECFSLKTVLMLADQLIMRIERMHKQGYLHCDLKPANCVMGTGPNRKTLYLIDMGLASKYLKPDGTHIPCRNVKTIKGTSLFMSSNVHSGLTPSRRDDMISIGYTLLVLLGVELPWEGACVDHAGMIKKSTLISKLCQGYPEAFVKYLRYCRGLKFDEEPDYTKLREFFIKEMRENKFQYDNDFDWRDTYF